MINIFEVFTITTRAKINSFSKTRGRYLALGHLVFFLNEKKINIFRLMHITLFLKVTY